MEIGQSQRRGELRDGLGESKDSSHEQMPSEMLSEKLQINKNGLFGPMRIPAHKKPGKRSLNALQQTNEKTATQKFVPPLPAALPWGGTNFFGGQIFATSIRSGSAPLATFVGPVA